MVLDNIIQKNNTILNYVQKEKKYFTLKTYSMMSIEYCMILNLKKLPKNPNFKQVRN